MGICNLQALSVTAYFSFVLKLRANKELTSTSPQVDGN